jgi:hypothetical protein
MSKQGELLEFPSRKLIEIDKELAIILEDLSERQGCTAEVTPARRELAEAMVEWRLEIEKRSPGINNEKGRKEADQHDQRDPTINELANEVAERKIAFAVQVKEEALVQRLGSFIQDPTLDISDLDEKSQKIWRIVAGEFDRI